MTEYRCLVVGHEGRSVWRRVEASDAAQAAASLAANGFATLDVREGRMTLAERLDQPIRLGSGVGVGEQALVIAQLASLVQSGLPVDRSLDLLRDQAPKARQRALMRDMLTSVREGQGLGRAMELQGMFPAYVVGIVKSAERSGQLGSALASLAERLMTVARTRRQFATALTYPAAVLGATLLSLLLVLTVVVPQFAPIFKGQEAKLPTLTRGVLWLSDLVQTHGLMLFVGLLAAPILLVFVLREIGKSQQHDGWRGRLPVMGLRDQYLAAQFTGLLGLLAGNGVKIVAALNLATSAIGSRRWSLQIAAAEQRVKEGERLSQALAGMPALPRTAVRLIEVGERTGTLAATCLKASEILADAAASRIDRIVALANPIAIITLGGVVAMLVGGVMLGIFSLGDFAG